MMVYESYEPSRAYEIYKSHQQRDLPPFIEISIRDDSPAVPLVFNQRFTRARNEGQRHVLPTTIEGANRFCSCLPSSNL